MTTPDNRLFCRLDGLSVTAREQQRTLAMTELGLLKPGNIPVFEEATQTAAHFLDTPVCILSLVDQHQQWFKSAVGLSRLGLMNKLATSRQFPRLESFCTHVVDSDQTLIVNDSLAHPLFAASSLVQQYGIRAYLGVPLIASSGICIGTLAVMDLKPRQFSDRDVEFLTLTARWSMSEFEQKQAVIQPLTPSEPHNAKVADSPTASQLKAELLEQLTQELRTPLTSVMGMASVLMREIYGPLTTKQKEYLGIIHHSGQYLLSLVNEILELSDTRGSSQELHLNPVDIEMLCQQAINTLEQIAQRRDQQIRLSVEPGRRIWLVDKDKVRQILYHLIFNVIQSSNAGSIVKLHVSQRESNLTIAIWVSHPWLGEGLPQIEYPQPSLIAIGSGSTPTVNTRKARELSSMDATEVDVTDRLFEADLPESSIEGGEDLTGQATVTRPPADKPAEAAPKRNLGLLLSRHLAELHGGQIALQGTMESGYRYVISLPQT